MSRQGNVLDEPCPCDACPFWARCRDELLACHAFALYVNQRPDDTPEVWMDGYVVPRASWYAAIDSSHGGQTRLALSEDRAAVGGA